MIGGRESFWKQVTNYVPCGVQLGLVAGPILPNTFISDLDDGEERTFSKCAEDMKLSGVWKTGLKNEAEMNFIKIYKGKCQILPLGTAGQGTSTH